MIDAHRIGSARSDEQAIAPRTFYEEDPDDDAPDTLPCGCIATEDCEECAPLVWCDGVRVGWEDDDGS